MDRQIAEGGGVTSASEKIHNDVIVIIHHHSIIGGVGVSWMTIADEMYAITRNHTLCYTVRANMRSM